MQCNMDMLVEVEKDISTIQTNGDYTIKAGNPPQTPSALIVNGDLLIENGAEQRLKGYKTIAVNGDAFLPDRMMGGVPQLQTSGEVIAYPEGDIILSHTTVLDRYFALRAKENQGYYINRCLVAVDSKIDTAILMQKKVRFHTPRLIVAEPFLSDMLSLCSEQTEITEVPQGCAYVADDAALNLPLIKRFGPRIYVRGDLAVETDDERILSQMSYLHVEGTLCITERQQEWLQNAEIICDDIQLIRGTIMDKKVKVTADRKLLQLSPQGVLFRYCVQVNIAAELSPEEILNGMEFVQCVNIQCQAEQKAAVEAVCKQCVNIRAAGEEEQEGGGIVDSVFGMLKESDAFNCDQYVL